MKLRNLAVASVAALAACSFAVTAHAAPIGASDDRVNINVVGGTRAPQTDWAVQLSFTTNEGTFGCTGEALNDSWILTARHCIEDLKSMDVYYSNSTSSTGPAYPADRVVPSPSGDIALVHLKAPKTLSRYAPLTTSSYTPRDGDTAVLMGYGNRANKAPTTGLFQANVEINGESTDFFNGPAIHINGVNGTSNHGDSGGPLMVNGKIVGVCSTGDGEDPGADIHAGSNYANLSNSLSWIRRTAGV